MKITKNNLTDVSTADLFEYLLNDKSLVNKLSIITYNFKKISHDIFNYLDEKPVKLMILIELINRCQTDEIPNDSILLNSDDWGRALVKNYQNALQEELIVVFLDMHDRVIMQKVIFKGTLDMATVHPRDIIRQAIKLPCSSIMIAHNHPSGLLKFSDDDKLFTNRLRSCCQLFSIQLIDHLIIGKNGYLKMTDS